MSRTISSIILLALVIILGACIMAQATAASEKGASITGRVYFSSGTQGMPNGTMVGLVNTSNISQFFGYNVTPDKDGYYQFTNVSNGHYKVYAWSPYYVEGTSEGIEVTSNGTYTSSVVLIAMPYRADITASTKSIRYMSSADITMNITDYWGRTVGSGWQILMRTTVGVLTPDNAFTDSSGKVYSNLPWVDNSTGAEITVFAISSNGSSYPLQESLTMVVITPTPAPSASASVTATPTASATVAPNATATATATVTVLPTATATPAPTPGFVLIGALAAMGLAIAFKKYK